MPVSSHEENGKNSQAVPAEPKPSGSGGKDDSPARFPEIPWPSPIGKAAYYGLAGQMVASVEANTEADPVALLVHLLLAFGNIVGRNPYFPVGGGQHYMNENAVCVGVTSKGRKGTAHARSLQFFTDPEEKGPAPTGAHSSWLNKCQVSGLSSGEGLITAVRDPLVKKIAVKKKGMITGYQEVVVDSGVDDKRLLVSESEFARVLKTALRDGNVLSTVLRVAWDGGPLSSMTKVPLYATGAHISIMGHITKEELLKELKSVDAVSGFGNRFLWICVMRSKLLPEGGETWTLEMKELTKTLKEAVAFARTVKGLHRDQEAKKLWAEIYKELAEGKGGLLGAMTSRAEAHVLRLSGIYALLDQSAIIRPPHLEAASALWKYSENSAAFIFGKTMADPHLQKLQEFIRECPGGRTRTEINNLLSGHKSSEKIDKYKDRLIREGEIRVKLEPTGGRPIERWIVITVNAPAE
ncbi:MAG: DUF3987 domain-containing protein [Planctomycetota bacterium]|nr:DUF3987 domain-containing protein [Planctomycetota bacterium]